MKRDLIFVQTGSWKLKVGLVHENPEKKKKSANLIFALRSQTPAFNAVNHFLNGRI